MSVKIYVDAASNLFKDVLKKRNSSIVVMPMSLKIDEKEYLCYSDEIDVPSMSKDFYGKMKEGAKPKTSLINPSIFADVAKKEIERGNEVVFVTLASGISGTYQSASLAAGEVNDEYGREVVKVIDSKTAGFGEGMVALKAEQYASEGLSLEEVTQKTEEYVKKVRSEFTVDNIKYLANTGRVSNFTAVLANVLMIKPLLYGSDMAKIVVTSKVRGRKNAIKALATQVLDNIADKDSLVYVAHCDCLSDAEELKKRLNDGGANNIETYYYDLVTGSHVGPGTVAVFYEGHNRAIEHKSLISKVLKK